LADRAAVAESVAGVDAIVHLAARAGIPDSVSDPLGTFEVNVAQTLGVLDAARRAGARRFVFASSNAAAGDHADHDAFHRQHQVEGRQRQRAHDELVLLDGVHAADLRAQRVAAGLVS